MTDQEIKDLNLKHFSPETDTNINWDKIDPIALKALDNTREDSGVSIFITSNYRTPENPAGFPTDAHRLIPCPTFDINLARPDGKWDSQKAFKLIPAAIKNGFTRIGINFKNNSLHIDMAVNFPQQVLFIE